MKRFLIGMLALVLVAAPCGASGAADPAGLLAKHYAFAGWRFGDGTLPLLEFERAVTDRTGNVVQHAHEVRLGLLYRRDYLGTDFTKRGTGFNGNVVWESNRNGFVTPFNGNSSRFYMSLDAIFSDSIAALLWTPHGTALVHGKTMPVLHAQIPGGFAIDVAFDPDSGAYRRVVLDPDGVNRQIVDIDSYMDVVPGKKYIASWMYNNDSFLYTYTKVTVPPRLDDSAFRPEAPGASWKFADARPFKIQVTADRIYVDGLVNGVSGHFIFDTGDSGITLTDAFANRARVRTVSTGQMYGFGGGGSSLVRLVDSLEIGGNTLSNVIVDTIGHHVDDESRETVDGLIGFDFLAGAVVTVDTQAQTAKIQDPSTADVAFGSGMAIAVDLTLGSPLASVKLNGNDPVDALFDTGNPAYIMLAPHTQSFVLNMHLRTSGINGPVDLNCGHLASIAFGPVVYNDPIACESTAIGTNAVVGFDFLRRFNYVFDYPRSIVVMTPH